MILDRRGSPVGKGDRVLFNPGPDYRTGIPAPHYARVLATSPAVGTVLLEADDVWALHWRAPDGRAQDLPTRRLRVVAAQTSAPGTWVCSRLEPREHGGEWLEVVLA
jgi:hypothetical protein